MTDHYSHITSSYQHSVQKQLIEHYAHHAQQTCLWYISGAQNAKTPIFTEIGVA